MNHVASSVVNTRLRELRRAIGDSKFSPHYKGTLRKMLDDALATRNPQAIADAMQKVGWLVRPSANDKYDDVRALKEPLPEGPLGLKTKKQAGKNAQPKGRVAATATITSDEINAAIHQPDPVESVLRSVGLDPGKVDSTKGGDGARQREYLEAIEHLRTIGDLQETTLDSRDYERIVREVTDPDQMEKAELEATAPSLYRMKYGPVDAQLVKYRDDKGTFVVVVGEKTPEGEAKVQEVAESGKMEMVPLGILTEPFCNPDSERITDATAKRAHEYFLEDFGLFAKVLVGVRTPDGRLRKVEAIVFYDDGNEAVGRIWGARPIQKGDSEQGSS